MKSAIAGAINLGIEPVALVFTDEKPAGAVQFETGKWGCVLSMFGAAATKGRTAVFDRETYGCFGGGMGLGFGNTYEKFPGGVDGFCGFLSNGNEATEQGRRIGEGMKAGGARAEFVHHFLHGELSFTIPFQRFLEMEANIAGSFLEQEPWVALK
ncbi:MAG TPA: DUF169 domain-containing protein [Geobacteraceae bacterium]